MMDRQKLKSHIGLPERKLDTYGSTTPPVSIIPTLQNPPLRIYVLIVAIIKTTDDEISPSLHIRIDLVNTNTLSYENLMIAGIGRNM